MKSINTVNIISISLEAGFVEAVNSFPDTDEGNKDAEGRFCQKANLMFADFKELDFEDVEDVISDGIYEGNYMKLLLIHSD